MNDTRKPPTNISGLPIHGIRYV